MIPEGYLKVAIERALEAGLLAEVMEYALDNFDPEYLTKFQCINESLEQYKLQTIPELPDPVMPKIFRIRVKREENWEEPFRIEYDGKYITLFGKDKNHVVPDYGGHGEIEYEEMVLVPVVEEIRNIIPKYADCDKNNIEIGYILKEEESPKLNNNAAEDIESV